MGLSSSIWTCVAVLPHLKQLQRIIQILIKLRDLGCIIQRFHDPNKSGAFFLFRDKLLDVKQCSGERPSHK